MAGTKRTPLRERILPDYTRGEEITNMVTHIIGGAVGLLILIGSVMIGAKQRDAWAIVSGSIYGFTTCTLFVVSSVYHGLPDCMGKRVMQVVDHCTIYFMIAGTYTPVLLVKLRPESQLACWAVFAVEWGSAFIAGTLTAIDLKKYAKMSMVCYLAMGWAIVPVLGMTIRAIGWKGFWWLLAGGICYTIGAVLYGLGKKKRYMHSVFHVCVNLGSMFHALVILFYVL